MWVERQKSESITDSSKVQTKPNFESFDLSCKYFEFY